MKSGIMLLCAIGLAACGSGAATLPGLVVAAPAPTGGRTASSGVPLLLYFDGKDSCAKLPSLSAVQGGDFGSWASGFGAAVADAAAKSGSAPDVLLSCLPFFGHPGLVTYYYLQPAAGRATAERTSPGAFLSIVTQAVAAASGPVFMAGHSYGGWLAMQAAAQLPSGTKLTTLLTIDPISPVACTPLKGIADYLRYGVPAGCNEAPPDLAADQLLQITIHTSTWLNYFETANAYLHASAIAAATTNIEVPYAPVGIAAGLASENNPHLYLATDPATWTDFLTGL